MPIHFHTHDTSGINAASILKASEAGVHVADGAIASMSGITSQPNLNSLVAALANTPPRHGTRSGCSERLLGLLGDRSRALCALRHGSASPATAEVYIHEMPGGQFTNLKEQAESMGLGPRWPEIARTYAEVQYGVRRYREGDAFEQSCGRHGHLPRQPRHDGAGIRAARARPQPDYSRTPWSRCFPARSASLRADGRRRSSRSFCAEQSRSAAVRARDLKPVDFAADRWRCVEKKMGANPSPEDVLSYLMYPEVFVKFAKARQTYGPVDVLPTPEFFFGMQTGDEITVDAGAGQDAGHQISHGERAASGRASHGVLRIERPAA